MNASTDDGIGAHFHQSFYALGAVVPTVPAISDAQYGMFPQKAMVMSPKSSIMFSIDTLFKDETLISPINQQHGMDSETGDDYDDFGSC